MDGRFYTQFSELEKQTISDIERLQDFQAFTGHSYDRYWKMVSAGHIKESVHNVRTHNEVSSVHLSQILLKYLDDDLSKITIYQLVSYFDEFYNSFIRIIGIKSDKYQYIRSMNCREADKLMELKETRHVIAHRNGIVDKTYIREVRSLARAPLGQRLPFSRVYVYDSADFLKRLVSDLCEFAIKADT